jgi:hypothetical protein
MAVHDAPEYANRKDLLKQCTYSDFPTAFTARISTPLSLREFKYRCLALEKVI